MLDLKKLTPAPWVVKGGGICCGIVGPNDEVAFCPEDPTFNDAQFIALARNAFDVMMRRGWYPSPSELEGEGWRVEIFGSDCEGEFIAVNDKGGIAGFAESDEFNKGVNVWQAPDPFTALVEADAWYKANVEAQPVSP